MKGASTTPLTGRSRRTTSRGAGSETRLSRHALDTLTAVLGRLPAAVSAKFTALVEEVPLAAGKVLFRRGDPADALYLVVSGRLRLSSAPDDVTLDDHVFEEIGQRTLTGSGAIHDGARRTASAFAARDSLLLRVPREAIEVLAARAPEVMLRLSTKLLEGIRPPLSRPPTRGTTSITIVSASPSIDLRVFISRLFERFHGIDVAHVWGASLDSDLGIPGASGSAPGTAAHDAVTRRLHEIEDAHELVLYEATLSDDAWATRALRQADQVLVVSDPDADPTEALRALREGDARPARARIDVVLVHGPGVRAPRGSARWFTGPAGEVFHLRSGSTNDLDRLARILSGRMTALILGGGGARGFAHLGVMRALDEAGIIVDAVGGSSIGAIMATMPATEVPLDARVELAKDRFARVLDRTLPMVSLMKGKRVTRALEAYFGDIDIADLWLPTFFTTTNLTRSRVEIHRSGSVVRALRASTAIPGVFPPVTIDRELHVDGGVLNNLPIDAMRHRFPHATIIAVDVFPTGRSDSRVHDALWESGWNVLWRRIARRSATRLPGLADTMVRATLAASTRDRDRLIADQAADLYLPIDLRGISPLDFSPVASIAERGQEAAAPLIAGWMAGDREA